MGALSYYYTLLIGEFQNITCITVLCNKFDYTRELPRNLARLTRIERDFLDTSLCSCSVPKSSARDVVREELCFESRLQVARRSSPLVLC